MGPIPAGSTLGRQPHRHALHCCTGEHTFDAVLVFETELMGIKGVPKPESIVTKATASTDDKAEETETEASTSTSTGTGAAEKIAEKVGEAAEVIGTMLADTDDSQEHNEL